MTSKLYTVEITARALTDLDEIQDYLVSRDAAAVAETLIDTILERAAMLETFPMRGSIPREVEGFARGDVRQIVIPPYRLIYTVDDIVVTVQLVADGRRDMRALLRNRLLHQTGDE